MRAILAQGFRRRRQLRCTNRSLPVSLIRSRLVGAPSVHGRVQEIAAAALHELATEFKDSAEGIRQIGGIGLMMRTGALIVFRDISIFPLRRHLTDTKTPVLAELDHYVSQQNCR